MAFSKGNNSITIEELEEQITQGQIAHKYLGINSIPCLICSPLRKDRKPSMGIYSKDGKHVNYIDFATKERGSIYDLLSKVWQCSFKKTIDRINTNFVKDNNEISIHTISSKYKEPKLNCTSELKCRIREWKDYDIDYWESYGISRKWLDYAEVYPISHKIIIKNNKEYVLGADKYAYAFVERKEGNITLKIYQPFNKHGYKWSNKHDRSVISLWTKIPKQGEKVVICSSLKDALCLWANTGIPALAVQGEGYDISDTAINELKKRYKEIYILFDNDKPGLEDGKKLSKRTGFTNLILPQFEGGKDISDLYKIGGKDLFKKIVITLFKIQNSSYKI